MYSWKVDQEGTFSFGQESSLTVFSSCSLGTYTTLTGMWPIRPSWSMAGLMFGTIVVRVVCNRQTGYWTSAFKPRSPFATLSFFDGILTGRHEIYVQSTYHVASVFALTDVPGVENGLNTMKSKHLHPWADGRQSLWMPSHGLVCYILPRLVGP